MRLPRAPCAAAFALLSATPGTAAAGACSGARAPACGANDAESFVQQFVGPHATTNTDAFSRMLVRLMRERNASRGRMAALVQERARALGEQGPLREGLAELGRAGAGAFAGRGKRLAKGWDAFAHRAQSLGDAGPQELLEHAKMTLLETGVMQEMRQMAFAASNASRSLARGAEPLDSMVVGFKTNLAPWNNVLKEFGLPLLKASFTLFSEFYGSEGNAARLCVGANVDTDSTYWTHRTNEFGGIGLYMGPAKWDNTPGWSFGAGGGIDSMKASEAKDFGWTWTLAHEPKTASFLYDVALIGPDGLKASILQTGAQAPGEARSTPAPVGGSTWLGHSWCSPDWENTPLAPAAREDQVAEPSSKTETRAPQATVL